MGDFWTFEENKILLNSLTKLINDLLSANLYKYINKILILHFHNTMFLILPVERNMIMLCQYYVFLKYNHGVATIIVNINIRDKWDVSWKICNLIWYHHFNILSNKKKLIIKHPKYVIVLWTKVWLLTSCQ